MAEPTPRSATGRGLQRPRTLDDGSSLSVGSLVGSLALVWVLYEQILPLSGRLGFVVCWFAAFLALYAAVSAMSHPRPVVLDRLASAVGLRRGRPVVVGVRSSDHRRLHRSGRAGRPFHHLNFFTHDMAGVGPQDPLNHGGVLHAIVGSLIEVGIAVASRCRSASARRCT